ncbi:MetQ/NlpA family ABC transporter substrate-binding protein, partial [Rhizobium johnstonii]|uniref:MetQ/NlpA family ABC transporter substrate-binding protein n=1 Tax=Rhizobium johnstonii TaxID=3019933 RepID=UPI003F9695D6
PDDPANGGRALHILESAGLITIAKNAGDFPTTTDVTDNPKNLQFVEIGARTIPQQFDDPSLSAVVVGTSYFDPSQNISKDDALFLDDPTDEANLPYVNVVAVNGDDVDNP